VQTFNTAQFYILLLLKQYMMYPCAEFMHASLYRNNYSVPTHFVRSVLVRLTWHLTVTMDHLVYVDRQGFYGSKTFENTELLNFHRPQKKDHLDISISCVSRDWLAQMFNYCLSYSFCYQSAARTKGKGIYSLKVRLFCKDHSLLCSLLLLLICLIISALRKVIHQWRSSFIYIYIYIYIYRVIQNDCRCFNNLSYTIHLR
jgi:hypothetical protein